MGNATRRLQPDVAVIGAGPAGLAAACVTAENGAKVALLDNSPWLGGQIWRGHKADAVKGPARPWLDRLRKSGAEVSPSATVFAAPAANVLLAETPEGVLEVRWKKLILATGARERFIPFPGWTLPGVVGPGGLLALVKLGWPISGKRVAVAGSGPLLLAVADGLKQAGARISLVAEQTDASKVLRFGLGLLRYPGKLAQAAGVKARLLGVPYRCGCWPTKAAGSGHVESVTLTDGSRTWTEACNYLACGFDLVPNTEIARLLGCVVVDGFVRVNEFQMTSVPGVFCAGEMTGIGGADCALVEGQVAGWAAVEASDRARGLFALRARWYQFRAGLRQAFALRPELRQLPAPDTFICRCEDVRMADVKDRASWRAAKLHTRCGMGSCQGRTCGAAVQFLFGWETDSVRPPLFPVRLETLAGDLSHPEPNSLPTTKATSSL
jgi:D-hydroxyproline dehydrogenase subunit alpha